MPHSIIEKRKTTKILSDTPIEPKISQQQIEEILQAACHAPFHYPCDPSLRKDGLNAINPIRLYYLTGDQCNKLATWVNKERTEQNAKKTDACYKMLNAAELAIFSYWLPTIDQSPREKSLYPGLTDLENIAAASASVQNILLEATFQNLPNYWYSGGPLRTNEIIYKNLNIPLPSEFLLGIILIFPQENNEKLEMKSGALRSLSGNHADISRAIKL